MSAEAKKHHIVALDGLRALAALFVVFSHLINRGLASGYSTSTIGVAIFFTLSGFLMGYLYLFRPFSFGAVVNYGISRFSRIAPAYLSVVIFSYIIFSFIDHSFVYNINNSNLVRHLLFVGNVSVFWSIPPEVQFYVFFIIAWLVLSQYLVAKKHSGIIILSIFIVLLMLARSHFPGTTLPAMLHFFLFGSIAGGVRFKFKFLHETVGVQLIQLFFLAGTIIFGIYLVSQYGFKYPYEVIYYAALTSVMVFWISYPTKIINLLLANKPLSLIGKWSFSLYLTHEIVLQIVEKYLKVGVLSQPYALTVAILGAIALSWLMFEIVERPTQGLIKQKLADRLLN